MKLQSLLAVLGASLISVAAENLVPISNHSFEVDDVSGLTNQLNADVVPTGWLGFDDGRNNATAGNARGLAYLGPGPSAIGPSLGQNDGSQSFFTAQRDIYQVLDTSLQANTSYTLTLAIGDRDTGGSSGGLGTPVINLGYGVTPGANNLIVLNQANQPTQVNGSWVTWSGRILIGSSHAGIGQPLRIDLANGTNVGWFDNVRLTAGPGLTLLIERVDSNVVFTWNSHSGKVYDLLYDDGGFGVTVPAEWPIYMNHSGVAATPPRNILSVPAPTGDRSFFVLRERDPEPGGGGSNPIKVILMAGQSNMLGSGTDGADLPAPLNGPQGSIQFTYGGSAGSISGLTNLQPGSGLEFGPEITFGHATAANYSSEQFAIIKYANSATSLENDWDPAGGSSFNAFVSKVTQGLNALTAAGYTPTVTAMLWTQGERDAREGFEAAYEANLNTFIADIRTRFGADLPFFFSQLSSQQTNLPATGLNGVRGAQSNVAAADAKAHLIVTDTFELRSDKLHYSSAGQISLGEAFAASYHAAYGP